MSYDPYLGSLYRTDKPFRQVLTEFASRSYAVSHVTVDRLQTKLGLSRSEIVSVFKTLARLGYGQFVKGSRGNHRSRFIPASPIYAIGWAARRSGASSVNPRPELSQ